MTIEEQIRTYGEQVERLATEHGASDAPRFPTAPPLDPPRRIDRRRPVLMLAAAAAVVVVLSSALLVDRGPTDVSGLDAGPTPSSASPAVPSPQAPPPAEPDAPVSLWLSATRVPPGPVEIVALLINHTGVDVTFGVPASVERLDGDSWVPRGGLAMCLDHWYCTARVEPNDRSMMVRDIGLGPLIDRPGPAERFTTDGLEVGWYRVSQTANESIVAAAVFEIAEGAPAPAPLVGIDAAAISVQPALVAAAGGKVTLSPLIPPVQGSQTMEHVEQAVAGLAETAGIERWDGSTWINVATVALVPPAPGASTVDRSAQLPPLTGGEYRLVRTGPGDPHIGRFWIAASSPQR